MMTLHPFSPGNGYVYLTRQVAAHDVRVPAGTLDASYAAHGESPGWWLGAGLAGIDVLPGSTVKEQQMTALFAQGRHPATGALLGRRYQAGAASLEFAHLVNKAVVVHNTALGKPSKAWGTDSEWTAIRSAVATEMFTAAKGRMPGTEELASTLRAVSQSRVGIAGFDLAFTAPKSISALWAVVEPDAAATIEEAHRAAVIDTVEWLERHAAYIRLQDGYAVVNTGRFVKTRGFIAAAFIHRDSRAGDPNLHTHVAVSSKVQTADGRWRGVQGRLLKQARAAAAARYETRLEANLSSSLGIGFADRPSGAGRLAGQVRQPSRDIVGLDSRLLAMWSSRSHAIERRHGQLEARFVADLGRAPLVAESRALSQRATLETRQRKHEPRSESHQRQVWRSEASALLGADHLASMLADVNAARGPAPERPRDVRAVAEQVVAALGERWDTWREWQVRTEAERAVHGVALPRADLDAYVDAIVTAALAEVSIGLDRPVPLGSAASGEVAQPGEVAHSGGYDAYHFPNAALYTSQAVMAAERTVLAAAERRDGLAVSQEMVDLAILEQAACGVALSVGQAGLVRSVATSGARVQLAHAPAGAEKRVALRVLADVWTAEGGTVLGVAPTSSAVAVLRETLNQPCEFPAALLERCAKSAAEDAPTVEGTVTGVKDAFRGVEDMPVGTEDPIGAGTLLVIDPAAMIGAGELARIVTLAVEAGASVRLIEGDRRSAGVGADAILRTLAATYGTVTLNARACVADPAEAAASLAVRNRNADAAEVYLTHRRVHVGDSLTTLESAFKAWWSDHLAGLDTILLAESQDTVRAFNQRVRTACLGEDGTSHGAQVRLQDGSAAGVGDTILTRHHDRALRISRTEWVNNGDRWTIAAVRGDGGLDVQHRITQRAVTLPGSYVAHHVSLGYAATFDAAPGLRADTSHSVLTGSETRDQLVVAATRGRHANHIHVVLAVESGRPPVQDSDTHQRLAAADLLRGVIAKDGADRSATPLGDLAGPARRLAHAAARYGELSESRSVVGARIGNNADGAGMGPLPWLTAAPGGTSDLHRYLGAQAARITLLAEQVAHQALDDGFPGQYWVRRLRRSHPELLARAAIWQAAHGAPLSHHRLVHADSNLEGSPYARDLSREIREALAVSRTAREFRSDQLRRAQSVAAIHL